MTEESSEFDDGGNSRCDFLQIQCREATSAFGKPLQTLNLQSFIQSVHELTRDALGMLAQVNQIQTREGTAARLGNDPTDPIVSLERYDCRHDREAWSWRAVLAVHGPIPAGWDETDRDETILRACEDSFGIRVQQETEGGPGGAFAEFPVVEYWPSVRDCRTIYVSQLGGLDV